MAEAYTRGSVTNVAKGEMQMKHRLNLCESVPGIIKALSVPAKRAKVTDSVTSSVRSIGRGAWAILAILLAFFVGATVLAYLGWTDAAGTDVPAAGYAALALGVVASLAVGFGLMALVFYSSRAGYDEPARLVRKDEEPSDPQP